MIRAGISSGAGRASWLDQVIVKKPPQAASPGRAPRRTACLGLPARSGPGVCGRGPKGELGLCEVHFAGHTVTGQDWLAALTEVAWEQGLAAARRRATDRPAALGPDAPGSVPLRCP